MFPESSGNMSRSLGEWEKKKQVFPQLFEVLPNFHECYHNFMETRKEFSVFYKINAQKIFCFLRVMVNGFQSSSGHIVSCLFYNDH